MLIYIVQSTNSVRKNQRINFYFPTLSVLFIDQWKVISEGRVEVQVGRRMSHQEDSGEASHESYGQPPPNMQQGF